MINALQLHEIQEVEELTEDSRQRFEVKDVQSLSWVLRKLAALEAKKTEINQIADFELERIEHFRKKELESIQDNENFFRGLISEYAIRKRDDDPKFKIKTPYGSVGFKKQQPKWNYDDKALIAYLNENELYDFVRVKQEPNKVEIKKQFNCTEDGRVYDPNGVEVQGIKVESKPDELVIKLEV
ncbi:host-nuclease inhibitor Gam family protein [Paenibacillus larvae]|uniref:Mu-like prophage host-nuclease inhibitor protein Gam n=1 Tax=Paenibacillus larvae subsp. larvae TaxID=147375 RepID=A0A6C0QPU1_9BACL|nr:host-nuclease inhibitor Gam family protein [Paenibacillus larvae]QHZ50673.1 Mu-like prophage host-nuclease inhibitor protein Gam [Paenibacillus larvae subsp. larvae]QHZ50886.1 Mu-like prophage host-nuclease inhibitor protein Gam [Paenibacillus larvae subsp. larvae]